MLMVCVASSIQSPCLTRMIRENREQLRELMQKLAAEEPSGRCAALKLPFEVAEKGIDRLVELRVGLVASLGDGGADFLAMQ